MEPKEYLNQIRYIDKDIASRIEEKNKLKSSVEIKTTSFNDNKVQETTSGRYDDKYTKYIEISESINQKIDELFDLKMKVSNEIDAIDKSEQRIVLRMRYINLRPFEEIAVYLSYDIRQIHRIHGAALVEFGKQMELVTGCHGMSHQ